MNGRKKQNLTSEPQFNILPVFKMFPNPTEAELTVGLDQKDGEIDIWIYDVLNRIVLQDKLTVKNYETKLKVELHNGIYFVSIKSNDQRVYSERLIIQR